MYFVDQSKFLGMENYNMIINSGLIVILCSPQKSSGNCVMLHFLQKVRIVLSVLDGYATEDGHTTSVAHWLEEDDFRKNGGVMNHETVESISKRKKPFTVDYTGFGWVLIKKGVFENLEYPWFAPKMQVFESGAVQDMCGEDVSFCLDAIEKGYEIWCDPRIRVGHEKTRII